ncbi:FISUMP domain-containing protein [Elizabethkingia anophelis]|uniref:FISUMP domain-containing protein n=1 Tax=Elizabethkingia anophelis TaxID=1117645 RepID=UPI0038916CD2
MRKELFSISNITVIAFLGLTSTSITSCRSNDTEGNLIKGGIASVKVNLTGTDFAASTGNSGAQASVKSIPRANDNTVKRHGVLVTPSFIVETELIPAGTTGSSNDSAQANLKSSGVNATASNGNTAIAAIAGDPLGAGMMYRVIAYRQSDGSYQDYKDYTIGQPAEGLTLDAGETYDLIAYSKGNNTLPAISSGELDNINNATLNTLWEPFLYQKQTFTPTNGNNTINMVLRHKEAAITTVITSYIGGISNIALPLLSPYYKTASVSLKNNGLLTATDNNGPNQSVEPAFPSGTSAVKTSDPIRFIPYPAGIMGSFSADITIGGTTKTITLNNFFTAKAETQSTLNINLRTCGAYTAPGVYTEFMCQNLGATAAAANAFDPIAGNHGLKVQWGRNTTGTNGTYYYTQASDQANSGTISGWSQTNAANKAWNSGTETNPVKTSNDPCPSGYRVPTRTEWQGVVDYYMTTNPTLKEKIGTFTASNTNYGSGWYLKNAAGVRTLFLPAAAYRNFPDGTLGNRGADGYYWTSTEDSTNSYGFGFDGTKLQTSATGAPRTYGFSVRCIKDNTAANVNGGNTSWQSSGNINLTTTY